MMKESQSDDAEVSEEEEKVYRPDIQYAVKEICRIVSSPSNGSLDEIQADI